jgi:hypothetical protein
MFFIKMDKLEAGGLAPMKAKLIASAGKVTCFDL